MASLTSERAAGRLKARIRSRAEALGFAACRFADARAPWPNGEWLQDFVREGRHGDMGWMAETLARRQHPTAMWDEARTAIVLALNYGPPSDPLEGLKQADAGYVSVYARGDDYHEIIKGRLKELAGLIARDTAAEVKVFVDTAPLMEKPLAQRAGLGWQGKHTNLLSREHGNWLFLGVILSAADLPADAPEREHCGSCRACLDACPTKAFPAPFQLDARRCISYLTIEHAGPWPVEHRLAAGNRIYGCDDCLAVCPWNKFAAAASEARLMARDALNAPPLARLLALDDAGFRALFAKSPVKRIGRARFLRNVLYAAANSADEALIAPVSALIDDDSALVRGAVAWALSRLMAEDRFNALRDQRLASEADSSVLREWHRQMT